MIINALKNEDKSLASFGHLLDFVKPTIIAFSSISFSQARKLGNFVVYNLAKHVKHIRCSDVWLEVVPSHLHDVFVANYD